MTAQEFMFKVTNTQTNEQSIISLADLYGYEGEDNGVFIYDKTPGLPKSLKGAKVSNKSGYSDSDIDWGLLDFETIKEL